MIFFVACVSGIAAVAISNAIAASEGPLQDPDGVATHNAMPPRAVFLYAIGNTVTARFESLQSSVFSVSIRSRLWLFALCSQSARCARFARCTSAAQESTDANDYNVVESVGGAADSLIAPCCQLTTAKGETGRTTSDCRTWVLIMAQLRCKAKQGCRRAYVKPAKQCTPAAGCASTCRVQGAHCRSTRHCEA